MQYYLVTAHVTDAECGTAVGTAPVVVAAGAAPVAAGAEPAAGTGRSSRPSQSPQRDVTRGYSRYGVRHASQYERLPQANQAGRCYS